MGKKRNSRLAGYRAQSHGELWEQMLELDFSRHTDGLLIKQHPKTKFFGKGMGKVVGTAWADFIFLHPRYSFTFDAKSTGNTKKMRMKDSKLHQFLKLQLASHYGIPAFYLVLWQKAGVWTLHLVTEKSRWPFVMSISDYNLKGKRENGFSLQITNYIAERYR